MSSTRRPDTPVRTDPVRIQPYDWRYATQQQFRTPYDPYRGAPQSPASGAGPGLRGEYPHPAHCRFRRCPKSVLAQVL